MSNGRENRERMWRSLEELADDPRTIDLLRAEHAEQVGDVSDPAARRDFLKLMGASLALAGTGACTRQPQEAIVPWASAPEDLLPGQAVFYATAMPWPRGALGLLVESHMGRPTKVEGNPDHPASLGAADSFAQASVLSLYDPERSKVALRAGRIGTYEAFVRQLTEGLEAQAAKSGAGLRVLTGAVTSPSEHGLLSEMLERYPEARWHQHEALHRDEARAGANMAFGRDVRARHDLASARVVLSLGAELLAGPDGVLATKQLTRARRAMDARLFAVESTPTLTGAKADRLLALAPTELRAFAGALARELDVVVEAPPAEESTSAFAREVAAELDGARGASLVVVGDEQPAALHALAHVLNQTLGNVGNTVEYTDPVELQPSSQVSSLATLTADMRAGRVELLLVIDTNPCYDAPPDLDFLGALQQVPLRLHAGAYVDETAGECHGHVPLAHFLESWGDARAADGSVSIVQPLIAPLYGSHSALELCAVLAGRVGASGYELVRERWLPRLSQETGVEAEVAWRRALHAGLIPGTGQPARSVSVGPNVLDLRGPQVGPGTGLTALFRGDPATFDGRFAGNAWLQECPRPLSKLTWDNAALVAPATARELGLEDGDLVRLSLGGRSLLAPVMLTPGQAQDCVTLPLGYGRRAAGSVGSGVGFDAYSLRSSTTPWEASGLGLEKQGTSYELARTQEHHSMEGRDLIRSVAPGGSAAHHGGHVGETSMYAPYPYEGNAWAMTIDLDACTGCSACVVACQAENNIPVVGKREIARGREMHWLRIDRYYAGDPFQKGAQELRTLFQPVPCMQCENAPCELVCPVAATVHSDEGLNDMVYNRCVGTRYCSNNCPYKVRRFNFFRYSDFETESLKLLRNPDVTVRSRGVMEKCTYCVQRINAARLSAKKEDRPVRDGEVVTACQGTCPADAISFGNQNDPSSAVAANKRDGRNYGLLEELNTKPRTTYLARVDRLAEAVEHVDDAGHGEDGH